MDIFLLVSAGGLERCPRLLRLDVAQNEITSLAGLSACARLQCLDLSGNLLTTAPTAVLKDLPLLRDLDLSGNQLSEVRRFEF